LGSARLATTWNVKLLSLSPHRVSDEDPFLERYGQLRQRALALTGHDHGLAEDRLHDAFIQFTLGRPTLDHVADLETYLGGVMRHMHASHVRRAARRGVTATGP
jgi:DNA-directed RNA polymerase specialized sigma24 family protein